MRGTRLHDSTAALRVTGSQIDLFTGTVFPLDEEVDFSFTIRLDITPPPSASLPY
ncbi:hypothetical protein [Arthrobacter sp. PAMC25284]|uniref:hypothetical protein n=1 Tax=Arthrobacter sp. PAMC25284 TaxID=2861279 RepID=UPI001C6323FC|nr:hypothetical protein [Arthrobacter sp. PAMC25284]QYF90504.1 hypothetical protein KY499_04135 [Arthrobacter sp. PAMC25284]